MEYIDSYKQQKTSSSDDNTFNSFSLFLELERMCRSVLSLVSTLDCVRTVEFAVELGVYAGSVCELLLECELSIVNYTV